jgi:hypothetical protein
MNVRKPHPSTAATLSFAQKQNAMPKGNESSKSKDRKKFGTGREDPKTLEPTHEQKKGNPERSQRSTKQIACDTWSWTPNGNPWQKTVCAKCSK